MSHLYEDLRQHPPAVALAGIFQGAISQAPATIHHPVSVVIRQFNNKGLSSTPITANSTGLIPFQYTGARWQARDTHTLPAVGDPCIVILDDFGEAWVPVWWPATKTPPTVTGSRSGGTALTNLLTELATLGLITDGTTT